MGEENIERGEFIYWCWKVTKWFSHDIPWLVSRAWFGAWAGCWLTQISTALCLFVQQGTLTECLVSGMRTKACQLFQSCDLCGLCRAPSLRVQSAALCAVCFIQLLICEQVLFVYVSTLILPRLTDQCNFIYCTISNPGTGADDAFVLKRGMWRNATWPSHSRPAIAASARHFQICFLP